MNCGGQREERFVGADIRGGFFAADVLLARGERENESAAAFGVEGLAGEAAGKLADEFVARGDHADVRTAVTGRYAEALTFHRHDIGFGGRLHDAERDGFGDAVDEQRAAGVGDFGEFGNFFDDAEEIRRLHDYCGDIVEGFVALARRDRFGPSAVNPISRMVMPRCFA